MSNLSQDSATNIEMVGGFARYLFKYRSLQSDQDRSRIIDILDGHLWAAPRSSFNDPFDCAPVFRMRTEKGLQASHVREVANRFRGSRKERRGRLKAAKKRVSDHGFEALARSAVTETLDGAGIISLTERNDSLLMWGHYASNHTGVAIMIETLTKTPNFFKVAPFPVIYNAERPVLWYPKYEARELMEVSFLRKADVWSYEKEWRIIRREGTGVLTLPRHQIVGLVFGAKTDAREKDALKAHLENRSTFRFYQAALDPNEYRLSVSECS